MDERAFLHPENPLPGEMSIDETDFVRVFSFAIEQDLGKVVSLSRNGRSVKVVIRYIETETADETEESFEADGPLSLVEAVGGIYLTSSCALLSDRVRLRRTRFF